jgi:hypothetical protein
VFVEFVNVVLPVTQLHVSDYGFSRIWAEIILQTGFRGTVMNSDYVSELIV